MRDLRVEIVEDGSGLYITADPDGVWARSSELDETVTADWDGQGRLIGIEVAGSTARAAVEALVSALANAELADAGAMEQILRGLGITSRPTSNRTGAIKKRVRPAAQKKPKGPADGAPTPARSTARKRRTQAA
jgi:YD repeat-containing protein